MCRCLVILFFFCSAALQRSVKTVMRPLDLTIITFFMSLHLGLSFILVAASFGMHPLLVFFVEIVSQEPVFQRRPWMGALIRYAVTLQRLSFSPASVCVYRLCLSA